MKRASLKDSYQFILDDLDLAAELLALDKDFQPTGNDDFQRFNPS